MKKRNTTYESFQTLLQKLLQEIYKTELSEAVKKGLAAKKFKLSKKR